MLKVVALALFIVAAATVPSSAHEADQHMVRDCRLVPQIQDCEAKMTAFRATYVKAFRNDLAAQRSVAHALWRGNGVVVADWMPACTWYMTMIALGSSKLEEFDFENMRKACSLLRPDQVEIARNRARALGHRILAKDKIDTTVEKPDPERDSKLDGTAEPL